MSHIVFISVAASAIGLWAAIRGHRRYVVVGGAILVCVAIAALVWSRPSSAKFDQQEKNIRNVCHDLRSHLEQLRFNEEDPEAREQFPWSTQAGIWLQLAAMVRVVEPVCFPDYDPSCLTNVGALPPASYEVIKPTLHRLLDGLEHHTGCQPKLSPPTSPP